MIILVSQDFKSFAQALENLYDEPYIELSEPSEWIRDLSTYTISRLTIIGHSDSYYGEEQSFFGGNLGERVMLMEEFAHSLINLLKHNERLKPGFCKRLKHIDLIDFHVAERKFIAKILAKHIQEDAFLSEFGSHFIISSFANAKRPSSGTVLKTHPSNEALSFYTFDSKQAFTEYREIYYKLAELRENLHHLEQMPGHTVLLTNGQNREEMIAHLEKECQNLEKVEKNLLKKHTHKSLHITDPRQYLDKHHACQVLVADMAKTSHHNKEPTVTKRTKQHAKKPHFFSTKASLPPAKSATHTSYLEGHMFHHKSKHGIEEENHKIPNSHHHHKN